MYHNCERLNFLGCDFTGMIIETNLELIKDDFVAKDIKSNAKAFREFNWGHNLKFTNTKCKILEVGRNLTAIANYHLGY
jgi:hypothetical protein